MGVVVRRYIDFLILPIPTPLVAVLFCSSIPNFCSFLTLGAHARSEGYRNCPVCMCVYVCVSVRSFLPPRASRPRNIGTYVFTATRKKLLKS